MVDASLAPHRRIHLGQQRGWNLHKRHSAHEARGSEARHVSHHATAKCKQHRLAIGTALQQGIENGLQGVPVLVRFAIRQLQHSHLWIAARKRTLQPFGIQRRHGFIADNQRQSRLGTSRKSVCQRHGATSNHDGIGTITQIDMDSFGHG
ncbi:hypothetical protein D3C72_1940070 [compost metagenome]